MNIAKLVERIECDADAHDMEVHLTLDPSARTLGGSAKDELGTIRYYVNDTELLMYQVEKEAGESGISEVDAFWFILNSLYKI